MSDKARIIELQRQVRIAHAALISIKEHAHQGTVARFAEEAIDQMRPLDPKQPLQGLCGHERRKA